MRGRVETEGDSTEPHVAFGNPTTTRRRTAPRAAMSRRLIACRSSAATPTRDTARAIHSRRLSRGPYPAEWMTIWSVRTRVGNLKNNDPSLIEPMVT